MDWLDWCGRIGVAAACLLAVAIGLVLAVAVVPLYLVAGVVAGLRALPPDPSVGGAADDAWSPEAWFEEGPVRWPGQSGGAAEAR
jgi:hypothetical protein